jgi:hypothetical protein
MDIWVNFSVSSQFEMVVVVWFWKSLRDFMLHSVYPSGFPVEIVLSSQLNFGIVNFLDVCYDFLDPLFGLLQNLLYLHTHTHTI